jgi:hypothetical protein
MSGAKVLSRVWESKACRAVPWIVQSGRGFVAIVRVEVEVGRGGEVEDVVRTPSRRRRGEGVERGVWRERSRRRSKTGYRCSGSVAVDFGMQCCVRKGGCRAQSLGSSRDAEGTWAGS